MERFCKYVSSEYTDNSHSGRVRCHKSEITLPRVARHLRLRKDVNCLCTLRILSSVCDFTYLTLLLLLKSWQAQSRASRLATYPSGSSPIFPFSCQETRRGVNQSCKPAVARRYQENFSGSRRIHLSAPFLNSSLHICNKLLWGIHS